MICPSCGSSCEGEGEAEGYLQVTIEPVSAEMAGARWRVDGGEWHEGGETVTLASGEHTVSFEEMNTGLWGCFKPWIGWRPPEDLVVNITANEIKTVTVTYTFGTKLSTLASKSGNATGDLLLGAALAASLWRVRGRRGGVAR